MTPQGEQLENVKSHRWCFLNQFMKKTKVDGRDCYRFKMTQEANYPNEFHCLFCTWTQNNRKMKFSFEPARQMMDNR